MADAMQSFQVKHNGSKRKLGKRSGKMGKKKQRLMPHDAGNRNRVDRRMKKLYQKRARDYNSDDEDEGKPSGVGIQKFSSTRQVLQGEISDDGDEDQQGSEASEVSEDEDGGIQPGITKFNEGIKAFKLAFKKIIKTKGDDDVLGPVLSVHKKLLAKKLAEEEEDRKVKKEGKKEKYLIGEKGHVKPANYLDAHEKFLLGVATKGVVKLFNAVNKAQNAQKGLNPSRSKDEKLIKKRRKEAFFSELTKPSSQSAGTSVKDGTSSGSMVGEAPSWAPLRDNYMLTNPKLKDWDKMQDSNDADDFRRQSDTDSSSGDE